MEDGKAVLVHLEYIRASQERTERHLATLNGRTASLEARTSVLEDRNPGHPKRDGSIFGALGGVVGGILAGLMKPS
jgi:hypothetical protein